MVNNEYYHGRNAILAVLIKAVKAMLTDFGLGDTWAVVSSNQPTIQALQNKTVYVDIISRRRYGTQGTQSLKDVDTGDWYDGTTWYEELLVQIGGFLQRDPATDVESTLTSTDVIEYIQGCINANTDLGPGISGITPHGVSRRGYFDADWLDIIRSTNLRELDYETDSGLKEKFPQFDFTIVVNQKLLKKVPSFGTIEIGTERI